MSDHTQLVAEERTITGKQVKQLRRQGLIPAILYGHNVESTPVQVKREDLAQVLRQAGRSAIVQLKIGRKHPIQVAIKELHVDPISRELLHADFYQVTADEKLKMQVPLHFAGEAPVTKVHEVALVRAMDQVHVECYPSDLPGSIPVDMSRLVDPGSAIRVGDLDEIPGVTILTPEDEVIVSVVVARREVEEAAVAEGAERAEEAAGGEAPGSETGGQESRAA